MAKIIVVEGADQLGKETQSRMLVAWLMSQGYKATRVEVPVRDHFTYPLIYKMLKNGWANSYPNLFQAIQHANRLAFQTFTLPKLERENDYVVFDRWTLSSIIYGDLTYADAEKTRERISKLRRADLTIVIHGKSFGKRGDDAYEADEVFQRIVNNRYVDWADAHLACAKVSNVGSRHEVHEKVIVAVRESGLI